MKRSKELLEKRKDFVIEYVKRNQSKQMKVIVTELTEMLFLSERTIYNIILQAQQVGEQFSEYRRMPCRTLLGKSF